MELLLVLAAITAILGALISQGKNRPPLQGAIVGFFLSILGLLILACMPKLEGPSQWWSYPTDKRKP